MATSLPMKGGHGPTSYIHNSAIQMKGLESVKELVEEAIARHLEISDCELTTFSIADLGCSVGYNTIFVVNTIIESVVKKQISQSSQCKILEFHVFLNDLPSNDFNTLFALLPPPGKPFYVCGVPGSFHGRLFPKSSISLIHSSYCLHWLSKVPEEVLSIENRDKGSIHYSVSQSDVEVDAYYMQCKRDMSSFLDARSQELKEGGLILLILVDRPYASQRSSFIISESLRCLESCLSDLVSKGLLERALVESFKIPIFTPCREELVEMIEENGCFSIPWIEVIQNSSWVEDLELNQEKLVKKATLHMRTAIEGLISRHFGILITETIFELFQEKLAGDISITVSSSRALKTIFLLLKRLPLCSDKSTKNG